MSQDITAWLLQHVDKGHVRRERRTILRGLSHNLTDIQPYRDQAMITKDLPAILYNSDIPIVVLDSDLKILSYSLAANLVFGVRREDVGRPLDNVGILAADDAFAYDARTVLRRLKPVEREIETEDGSWFMRHISPYYSPEESVGGVVATFTEITTQKRLVIELEAAKQRAERATIEKSRFVAAASHDLRQPLQTLVLLREMLAEPVEKDKEKKLLARLDETLAGMSGMLNILLDVNQYETGSMRARKETFKIGGLFDRLKNDYSYLAQEKNLSFRVVPSSLTIESDAHLLERMIQILLWNAFKYTDHGKVLLGCRHHDGKVTIEVIDSGGGYRSGGHGLAIVQWLGNLLNHKVHVGSRPGSGSVFTIEVDLFTGTMGALAANCAALGSCVQINKPASLDELGAAIRTLLPDARQSVGPDLRLADPSSDDGDFEPLHSLVAKNCALAPCTDRLTIYIVEGNAPLREMLRDVLEDDSWRIEDYGSCEEFLAAYRPECEGCLIVDSQLPGMKGLELLRRLGGDGHTLPAIMIADSGDVPTAVRAMKAGAADFIEKPISYSALISSIERAIQQSRNVSHLSKSREIAAQQIADLTTRQRQVMELVLAGYPSKVIATTLNISPRTVDNHRAAIMRKTGAKSLPALARLALTAEWGVGTETLN